MFLLLLDFADGVPSAKDCSCPFRTTTQENTSISQAELQLRGDNFSRTRSTVKPLTDNKNNYRGLLEENKKVRKVGNE